MNILKNLFPDSPGRISQSHAFWNGKRKGFAVAILAAFILLQLLFLGNLSYLYGSLFHDAEKTHRLNILLVDYDQGILGQSLAAAVATLRSDTFLGIDTHTVQEYPDPAELIHAVRNGDFWGGVYTHPGASKRLELALQGGGAASTYNTSDVVTYVFNGVRYPTVAQGFIQSNMETLISIMRLEYNSINGTQVLLSGEVTDEAAAQVLLNPFISTNINIKHTEQGTRVLLNTVTMILPIIQQFFFLMALNGISAQFHFYRHLPIKHNAIIRLILGSSYTFLASLGMTGYIWGYKEAWNVGGSQFMLTWMVCWLYMHINFLVLDTITGFIPLSFLAFFVLTWAIMNITTTIFPFALNPGFYRWGYFFPAHSTWETLITIWSDGGYNRLYRSLPILFAWWVVFIPLSKSAMHWRCVKAVEEHEALQVAEHEASAMRKESLVSEPGSAPRSRHINAASGGGIVGGNPHMPMPFGEAIARVGTQDDSYSTILT